MTTAKDGELYLGKIFDMASGKLLDEKVMYDPADLTTHAIVTGMTGSGKTGMCVGLLEEAAIEGIPAIIIDPKGDLTNLLLHFPELRPEDFQPWIDPEVARREGKDLAQAALDTAESWRKGLEGWGLGPEQIRLLDESVDYDIFTPGSTSGQPINILSSFEAPELDWDEHREILREKISTIVTALLGLIGIREIDPLRSREHILLSNILENAWGKKESLTLTELILQTQTPPFERLGAFPVNNFFPEKDRFDLAVLLNNFLASPSFEVWREGQSLDIGRLLYSSTGKPRHNIFYLAHLNDDERMFFVTLLFAAIEAWMRTQRGTGSLRALVYFDEILGYLPPVANPPSRPIMLRMLKQARAFGVGLLLATQNPVDVDYKGLSNAGTWFIGRLQTDQDKQRLLDGLDSAGGGLNRQEADRLISRLGKRTFLLHNVHEKAPKIFQTRWVMNYLAGPLMRTQIPQLMKLSGLSKGAAAGVAAAATARPSASSGSSTSGEILSTTRPAVPTGVDQYYLPNNLSFSQALITSQLPADAKQAGVIYRPALLAQAEVAYAVPKYRLNFNRKVTSLPTEPRGTSVIWEDFPWSSYEQGQLHQVDEEAKFSPLPVWMSTARQITDLQKDFVEWVFRTAAIQMRANETLNVYAGPEVSEADFKEQCNQAAKKAMEAEMDKVESTYKKKIEDLERKITKQTMEVESQQTEVNQRRLEEAGKGAELIFGLLGGRKRSVSSNLTKRRMTTQAKADLKQEQAELEMMEKQAEQIEAEHTSAKAEVEQRWARVTSEMSEVPVSPYKKDIFVDLFGIAWMPYYQVNINGQEREIPAFQTS